MCSFLKKALIKFYLKNNYLLQRFIVESCYIFIFTYNLYLDLDSNI